MGYQIIPVFLGSVQCDKADSMYLYPRGEMFCTVYACFVIQGYGRTILVDSGLPSQEDIRKNGKPYRLMEDAPDILEALRRVHIRPEQVTEIILTHLHYDHSCNLELFPNAGRIYVQRRELAYALVPMEVEKRIYSLDEACAGPEWLKGLSRFQIVDGDFELFPGIRVILTPGHSPGSQSVVVDTEKGAYILTGDCIPVLECFVRKIPNAIHNDLKAWYRSHEKIAGIRGNLLPGHDACIFNQSVYG